MGFFDDIGSAFSSALTAPGTNARFGQDDRNAEVAGMGLDWLKLLDPQLRQEIALHGQMLPTIATLLKNMAAAQSQKNVGIRTDQVRRNATDQANRTGRAASATFGAGSAEAKGAQADALNQGIRAGNTYSADQYDPVKQQQQMAGLLQMIQQGTQPDWGGAGAIGGLVYGQPQTYVGQGIGDVLGQALGGYGAALGSKLGSK